MRNVMKDLSLLLLHKNLSWPEHFIVLVQFYTIFLLDKLISIFQTFPKIV